MTAVEWLCSQIYTIQVEIEAGNHHLKNKIEQAKEMEKEQIINAYNTSFILRDKPYSTADKYYNETFKSE